MLTVNVPSAAPDPAPANDADALDEIVRGVRVEAPPMSQLSNRVAANINVPLSVFVTQRKLGLVDKECAFVLQRQPREMRRPDVAFVSAERWPIDRPVPLEGDWEIAPDLAIEVASPHDLLEAMTDKIIDYFAFGVREVWVVHPRHRLALLYESLDAVRTVRGERPLETKLIPGFALPLAEVFPPTEPPPPRT